MLVNFTSTFKIAFPLMLSSLSALLMITVDRIMLASYDIMVMNAVAVVGALLFAFEHGFDSMAGISEVMAGHFNGAKQYDKVPISTWQMIFFGIASAFILVPVGFFLGPYLIPQIFLESGLDFFRILMSSLFLDVLFTAVAGFFIGTKQTKIVAMASFISNIINVLLNFLLIFGIEGWINPMGATGAAIGTSIALLLQFLIVFTIFLSKAQNNKYHTRKCRFDLEIMLKTLKIGLPNSIGYMMNILSGYVIMIIVVDTSSDLITMQNICMNISILIFATSEGVQKAVIGIGSNILGACEYHKIKDLIISALKIQILCFCLLSVILFCFKDNIINLYTEDLNLYDELYKGIFLLLIFYLVDGILWVLGCILIAGGDTKFTTIVDVVIVWFIRVVPLYFIYQIFCLDLSIIWIMSITSSVIMILIFLYRIFYSKWAHKIT